MDTPMQYVHAGQEVSFGVEFGPEAHAWLLRSLAARPGHIEDRQVRLNFIHFGDGGTSMIGWQDRCQRLYFELQAAYRIRDLAKRRFTSFEFAPAWVLEEEGERLRFFECESRPGQLFIKRTTDPRRGDKTQESPSHG